MNQVPNASCLNSDALYLIDFPARFLTRAVRLRALVIVNGGTALNTVDRAEYRVIY